MKPFDKEFPNWFQVSQVPDNPNLKLDHLDSDLSIAFDNYSGYPKYREDTLQFAGKFRTAEDLEKAYLELQKKLGSNERSSESDSPEAEDAEEDGVEVDPPVVGEEDQEDEAPAEREEEELPELSDEDIQAIYDSVGGEEAYEAVISWASEALSERQQDAFNEILEGADPDKILMAVQGLVARFQREADVQGSFIRGRSAKPGAKPFQSREQLRMAMSDPRYKQDPAYQLDVMARLEVSGDLL